MMSKRNAIEGDGGWGRDAGQGKGAVGRIGFVNVTGNVIDVRLEENLNAAEGEQISAED